VKPRPLGARGGFTAARGGFHGAAGAAFTALAVVFTALAGRLSWLWRRLSRFPWFWRLSRFSRLWTFRGFHGGHFGHYGHYGHYGHVGRHFARHYGGGRHAARHFGGRHFAGGHFHGHGSRTWVRPRRSHYAALAHNALAVGRFAYAWRARFENRGFNGNAFGSAEAWNDWDGNYWGGGWYDWGDGWAIGLWRLLAFLYGDALTYALWPYDYYDPFFAYGYDALLASVFWPGPMSAPYIGETQISGTFMARLRRR